ncbi:MAG: hypothetical protein HY901_33805 [Deltaproteobacteria bacterium]|nr:hypothetical protein [Deltaproteobacteria bacterium]
MAGTRKILDELGIEARAPPTLPARRIPRQESIELPPVYSGIDERYPHPPESTSCSGSTQADDEARLHR